MSVQTRRQYVNENQIEEFSNITITDETEAADQANMAEEMIDLYIRRGNKHFNGEPYGKATGGSTSTLIDTSGDSHLTSYEDDFYTYCEVEILSGSSRGDKRVILSYNKSENKITVVSNFTAAIAEGDVYIIRQLGLFPRPEDVTLLDSKYYKRIPEEITRATLAQLEYIIEKGPDFFSDAVDYDTEDFKDYAYTVRKNADRLISPHARRLLQGFINRTGRLIPPRLSNY
jgi:hypothetical protein